MKAVFSAYTPQFAAICRRYAQNNNDAKDLLQEGFIKIFSSVQKFEWKGSGSFSGWMKRIMVNNAIDYCNKRSSVYVSSISDIDVEIESEDDDPETEVFQLTSTTLADLGFTENDLIEIMQLLPEPFRIVFNLFVIEGKRHKEIAQRLGIEEKTSTTRLARARKMVRVELEKKYSKHLSVQWKK